MTPKERILRSHETYLRALAKMDAVRQFAKMHNILDACPEINQEVYEEIFTQTERAAWDRWVSGGTATPKEWRVIADSVEKEMQYKIKFNLAT